MKWSEIYESPPPLRMRALCAFMERWKPGSTAVLRPATEDQIFALAERHGGVDVLPIIYREFLEVMGESTGGLRLLWGTTAISELIEDFAQPKESLPNPQRFLKYGLGGDDYNGRHPDDFFDLASPTPDCRDATIIRIHAHRLATGSMEPQRPFFTFSDLLRELAVVQIAMRQTEEKDSPRPATFYFGDHPRGPAEAYKLLINLGFELTELGASKHCIPLEHADLRAIAVVTAPSSFVPDTGVHLRAPEHAVASHIIAVLEEYRSRARRIVR